MKLFIEDHEIELIDSVIAKAEEPEKDKRKQLK